MRKIWLFLLIGFAALNVYAVAVGDWRGLIAYLSNLGPWGTLATADLLIALIMAVAYMWRDARGRGVNPLPYAVLTLLTGSVGVLVYLVRFWGVDRPGPSPARTQGQFT